MDKNNIIFNYTIEQYNKKYKNRRHRLLRYTKKQVSDFDNAYGHYVSNGKTLTLEGNKYLLRNRKWALIGNTYYEIPKPVRYTWFRNLNGATQIVTSSLVLLALVGGTTTAVLLNLPKTHIETEDEKYITVLNDKLSSHGKFVTPYNAVMYLRENEKISIDTLQPKDSTLEYGYNLDKNEMVLIDKASDTIKYAKTKVEKKCEVWKFKDKYVKTTISSDDTYGTYLKVGAITQNKLKNKNGTNDDSKTIRFNSNIDVGENRNYNLIFDCAETIVVTEVPMVVTNYSDLTIVGGLDFVNHYGHASSLTLELNGDVNQLQNKYNEYGTVDGGVVIKGKTVFTAQSESKINSMLVESNDVKINLDANSTVGAVSKTEEVTKDIEDIVDDDAVPVEKRPDKDNDPIDPEDIAYSGGKGTEKAPYVISCVDDLKDLSTNINNETESGCYYIQSKDISFDGEEEFTPIGHKEYKEGVSPASVNNVPFVGNYDGNNLNINNLKLKTKTGTPDCNFNSALFGYVKGDANASFTATTSLWDYDNFVMINKDAAVKGYTSSVKNINLYNINVDSSIRYSAGLVGLCENAYVYNCHILSGNIKGYKPAGGIVCDVLNSIVEKCSTGDTLTVEASDYNVGGIAGTINYIGTPTGAAIIGCENNAKIVSHNNKSKGGSSAGICGMIQSGTNNYVIDCTNNGYVTTDSVTNKASSVAGICSNAHKLTVIANCINNGKIEIPYDDTNQYTADEASGIVAYFDAYMYNCHNYGCVSAYVNKALAGVCEYNDGDTKTLTVINSSNSGELISKNTNIPASELVSKFHSLKIKNISYSSVTELNKQITTGTGNATLEFENIKSENKDVPYIIRPGIGIFKANNTDFANNIAFEKKDTIQSITIYVDNFNMEIDEDFSNVSVTLVGENSKLTVGSNGKLLDACVSGTNAQVINNGVVKGCVGLYGAANYLENNGTCSYITFGELEVGTGEKVGINRGTISRKETGQNNHVINCRGNATCNITFYNYGVVEIVDDPLISGFGYLYCAYTQGTVTMYQYASSKNINGIDDRIIAANPKPTVHYNSNAELTYNGENKGWPSVSGSCVLINDI